MMRFTYEEDGITVTMETDAEDLMSDYYADGILEHFSQFLAACGKAVWPDDVLQFVNEANQIVLDSEEYDRLLSCEASVLDRLTNKGDDGWIEWHGGEQPVDGDTRVEVMLSNDATHSGIAGEFIWSRSGIGKAITYDIIRYRVLE